MKKINIVIIIVTLVLCSGVLLYLYLSKFLQHPAQTETQSHNRTVNTDPPTKEEVSAGSEIKKQSVTNEKPAADILSVTTTASSVNNGTLQIRVMVDQVISGTCTIVLTSGSTRVEKQAPIQPMATTSTCQGFDIAASELSSGQWQFTITVDDGTRTGKTTGEVRI